jgi:hypothetical protein
MNKRNLLLFAVMQFFTLFSLHLDAMEEKQPSYHCPLKNCFHRPFVSLDDRNLHLKNHKKATFGCRDCGEVLSVHRMWVRHRVRNHFDCPHCPGKFDETKKDALVEHMTEEHSFVTLRCAPCDYTCFTSTELRRHEQSKRCEDKCNAIMSTTSTNRFSDNRENCHAKLEGFSCCLEEDDGLYLPRHIKCETLAYEPQISHRYGKAERTEKRATFFLNHLNFVHHICVVCVANNKCTHSGKKIMSDEQNNSSCINCFLHAQQPSSEQYYEHIKAHYPDDMDL